MDAAAAFEAWKREPMRDRLVAVLEASQGRIYNICFQVLRHREDAEDAAQGVLLAMIDGLRGIRSAEHFRGWVIRASFNAALNAKRNRARRAEKARMRSEMTERAPDPAADALHEAVARLDDELRGLVVEHYFEKRPLQELAGRRGCSHVWIWKRIEEAKSKLKAALAGSAAIVPLDGMLDAIRPEAPAMSLVGPGILAKAAVSATLIGGIAMAVKGSFTGLSLLVALLLFLMGSFGGYVLAKKPVDPAKHVELAQRIASMERELTEARAIARTTPVRAAEEPQRKSAESPSRPREGEGLAARLARYRAWNAEWREKSEAAGPDEWERLRDRHEDELEEQLDGLRDLILADPQTFLAFAKARENDGCLFNLMCHGLKGSEGYRARSPAPVREAPKPQEFESYPRVLMDGLLELLRSGSMMQRQAVLNFTPGLANLPDEWKQVYVSLISDAEPWTQYHAMHAVQASGAPVPPTLVPYIAGLMASEGQVDVQQAAINLLGSIGTPEADAALLGGLETVRRPSALSSLTQLVWNKYKVDGRWTSPEIEDRMATAVLRGCAAMTSDDHPSAYQALLNSALQLSARRLITVLDGAREHAPSPRLKDAVGRMLEMAREGRTDPKELSRVLWPD